MLNWEKRPFEIANLFNPAFCAILLRDAAEGYEKEKEEGLPYPLSVFILPLVLHKTSRYLMPKTISSRMHVWLKNNEEVRIDFAKRVRHMLPYSKEALIFGMQGKIIMINPEGNLIPVRKNLNKLKWKNDSEPAQCRQKSLFLGRWLAHAGDISTVYAMWGIRP